MFSFQHDQAAGLRRFMAAPKPRVISVISALETTSSSSPELPRILANLAASLAMDGKSTHIVSAKPTDADSLKYYGLLKSPVISDLLRANYALPHSAQETSHAFTASRLCDSLEIEHDTAEQLGQFLESMAEQHDVVIVETALNRHQSLPIPILNDGMIIIQLNYKPASIKLAYSLIKQLHGTLGKRSFGILVHSASAEQSETVFNNIAAVARQFLSVELEHMGHIPSDEHIQKAHKLGRSVVDAFPTSLIAKSLRSLAKRLLGDHRYSSELDSRFDSSSIS